MRSNAPRRPGRDRHDEPTAQLEACAEAYARYCLRYPAFLDCALALMRRPAGELRTIVSDSIWFRLGRGMSRCIGCLADTIRRGDEAGAFSVEDPDFLASVLWTQGLGTMHLARIGVGVRELAPGVPGLFTISPEDVVHTCVEGALKLVGADA